MPPSLSIIIPAYNEAARLGQTIHQIFAYLNEQPYESELIIVDDGSKDETVEIAEEHFRAVEKRRTSARIIRVEPNRGKGYAVRTGLLAAAAPVALFSDADLSTPITETPKLISPIRAGEYDLVFGSRALDRSLIGVHQPWSREQSGRFFNLMMRMATRLPFVDTQCGFKAFRMDVCRPLIEACTIDRFGFDVELLYVAHAAGLRLKEWPVRWDDVEGSKVSFMTGLHGFGELRALRRQATKGVYDEAIKSAREIAASAPAGVPTIAGDDVSIESDASPELASTARRI